MSANREDFTNRDFGLQPPTEPVLAPPANMSAGAVNLTEEESSDEGIRQQILQHVWDRLIKAPKHQRASYWGIYRAIHQARPDHIKRAFDAARLARASR